MMRRPAAALLLVLGCLIVGIGQALAQSVCAEARIEIRQRVMLERQAFDASLRVTNGLSSDIELVGVTIEISREDGGNVAPDAGLFVQIDRIDDHPQQATSTPAFPILVAAQSAPTVHWRLTPKPSAGGIEPMGVRYAVGATVAYRIASSAELQTVEILPEIITVLPQPRLALDYFLAEEVHGDDPFTPHVVEPSIPFTLGVRVSNEGYGPARSLTIETAQPEIVENLQGLLVGFEIIEALVQDEAVAPTLLMDFGTVPAGQTRVGRWRMTTTLSGEFRALQTSYTHANTLGGAQTSLFGRQPRSHLLIKDVLDDSPQSGGDEVIDFLARLIEDDIPSDFVKVYSSLGGERRVEVIDSPAQVQLAVLPGGTSFQLAFASCASVNPGVPIYVKLPKPAGMPEGAKFQVSRLGSGNPLPADNVWLSKTRPSQGTDWDHYFNLFDASPVCEYAISLVAGPVAGGISGSVYIDSNENGQPDAGEPVIAEHAVHLSGSSNSGALISIVRHTTGSGAFSFRDLEPGTYQLEVAALPHYVDGSHSVGSAGGSASGAAISAIALGQGQSATGYQFAKIFDPQSNWLYADLSITAQVSPASVAVLGEVDLVLTLANQGPDASGMVRTQLVLPSGWGIVSAAPSAGSFDIDRAWVTPALDADAEHTLSLRLRAPASPGQFVVSALSMHGSDGYQDPQTANNSASILLQVEEQSPLSLTVEPAVLPRVLVLVGCGEMEIPIHPDVDVCVQGKVEDLPNLLGRVENLSLEIALTREEFIVALRSGRSNIVWLMESTWLLEAQDWVDLAAAVHNGDGLITTGNRELESSWLQMRLLGTQGSGLQDAGETVNTSLIAGPLTIADQSANLINIEGFSTVLGLYENRSLPAIIERRFGRGNSLTVGFPINAMQPAHLRDDLLLAIMGRVLPDRSMSGRKLGAAEYVSLALHAAGAQTAQFELSSIVSEGLVVHGGAPAPDLLEPEAVAWEGTFPASGQSLHLATLQQSGLGADAVLNTRLESGDGQLRLVQTALEVSTPAGLLAQAILEIQDLPPPPPPHPHGHDYRDDAIGRINSALVHLDRGEYEWALSWLASTLYFGCDDYCHIPSLSDHIGDLLSDAYRGIGRMQYPWLEPCDALDADVVEVGAAGFAPVGSTHPAGAFFQNGPKDGPNWQVGVGSPTSTMTTAKADWATPINWGLTWDLWTTIRLEYSNQDPESPVGPTVPAIEGTIDRLDRTLAILVEVERQDQVTGSVDVLIDSLARQGVDAELSIPLGFGYSRQARTWYTPGIINEIGVGTVALGFDPMLPNPEGLAMRLIPGYLRCRSSGQ